MQSSRAEDCSSYLAVHGLSIAWGDNDHCSERSPDSAKLPEYVDVTSFVPKATLNTVAIMTLDRWLGREAHPPKKE